MKAQCSICVWQGQGCVGINHDYKNITKCKKFKKDILFANEKDLPTQEQGDIMFYIKCPMLKDWTVGQISNWCDCPAKRESQSVAYSLRHFIKYICDMPDKDAFTISLHKWLFRRIWRYRGHDVA